MDVYDERIDVNVSLEPLPLALESLSVLLNVVVVPFVFEHPMISHPSGSAELGSICNTLVSTKYCTQMSMH